MELTRTGIPYHIDRATAMAHDLIVETLYLKRGKDVSRAKEDPVSRFVIHVQKEIFAHGIDVQEFCRREHIRYDTFRKHFRRTIGIYPHAYWLERKMDAAKEALFQDRTPVEQIAESLGFDDPFYFSRLFKSKTGLSPRQYRDESRATLF
jgi:AraC-like DNA-binding protein